MAIKAVLFDADGVVINPALQFARHLERVYGITPQMTRPFFTGVFKDCLLGKVDLKAVLPPFLDKWQWNGSVDAFVDIWLAEDNRPDKQLLEAIQALRSQGLMCGLATLQEQHRAAYMRSQMGFNARFDRLFFSCEMGCLKPDEAYYRMVEKALELRGEEILFWDDAEKNIIAARGVGWNAEMYLHFADFQEKLPKYLPPKDFFRL